MLSPKRVTPLVARRGLLTAAAGGAAATLIGCGNDKSRPATSGKADEVTYVTGFNITGVRHEASHNRAEVGDLCHRAVAAA